MALGGSMALAGCAAVPVATPPAVPASMAPGPPRVTMAELHQNGGVPPGWQFTPPPGDVAAGRRAFADFGCSSCHTVRGENFPAAGGEGNVGPDLSGMGSHHPAGYFAESILNPNAVLVDGPGYIGPDGRSVMPAYPELTLKQLADLVAYLQSLTTGGGAHMHSHRLGSRALSYFVQAYEVPRAQLDAFDQWFSEQRYQDYAGLASVETYVGRSHDGLLLVSVFGFDNDIALGHFLKAVSAPGRGVPGDFARPVDQYILRSPAVYKAAPLSAP